MNFYLSDLYYYIYMGYGRTLLINIMVNEMVPRLQMVYTFSKKQYLCLFIMVCKSNQNQFVQININHLFSCILLVNQMSIMSSILN